MTLKELYEAAGGNYEETLRRLMNEKLMKKYLHMFAEAKDHEEMLKALEAGQWGDAFRHAHNLKGVSLNLELGRLARTASAICDAVRGGAPTADLAPMAQQAEQDYALVMAGIRELQAAQG